MVPVNTSGLTNAIALSLNGSHSCAVRASGQVVCWGLNVFGQLGDGTISDRTTPVNVSGLTDAVDVAAGFEHSCARRASGQVVCWGRNDSGQSGDGTTMGRRTPVNVVGLTDGLRITAGDVHSCALRGTGPTGRVVCWGDRFLGQLGDGSGLDGTAGLRTTPVDVLPLP
jgi:alpha-tubulin suppressor-like RCC1 family protein